MATDDLPHVYPTVVHMFAQAVADVPQREALVCGDERLDYAEYGQCVASFAHELVASGAAGRNVGIVLGNTIDICLALFATHAARARTTACNPGYTARELRAIFEDADLHTVVYGEDRRDVVEPVAEALGVAHRICIGPNSRRLTRWRGESGLGLPQPLPAPGELASLQYTGGATGDPRG